MEKTNEGVVEKKIRGKENEGVVEKEIYCGPLDLMTLSHDIWNYCYVIYGETYDRASLCVFFVVYASKFKWSFYTSCCMYTTYLMFENVASDIVCIQNEPYAH